MRNKILMGIGFVAVASYVGKKYKDQIYKITHRFPDSLTKFNKIKEFDK